MNNSLTPIATISQSMQKKLQQTDKEINKVSLLEGISIINERANSLSSFISSYSQLSHLPEPNKTTFPLAALIENIAALFPACSVNNSIGLEHQVEADKNQFEQVLINLVKNAFEAMAKLKNEEKIITINCHQEAKWLHISIVDHGTGIANSDNLFVPFYTTKKQGSGIGLALCRQIMFNHNGLIKLKNARNHSGVEVVLSLPK